MSTPEPTGADEATVPDPTAGPSTPAVAEADSQPATASSTAPVSNEVIPGGGSDGPTSHRKDESSNGGGSFWKELPFLVLIALVLALLIKTFLVQAFYIPSASMEPTLQGGGGFANAAATGSHPFDRVLVNKLVYDFRDPRRGEIVVFKKPPGWPNENDFTTPSNPIARFFHDVGSAVGIAPSGGSDFIKRVIGVGGDNVSCKNDVLSVNGHVLTETYLYPGSHQCSANSSDNKSWLVPKGDLFVMGDHRDDSDDSRVNGYVPVHDVIGRAFVVIWPVKDWKTLGVPSTFKQTGLAALGTPAGPYVAGAMIVTPIGLVRRRRRRRRAYAAGNG